MKKRKSKKQPSTVRITVYKPEEKPRTITVPTYRTGPNILTVPVRVSKQRKPKPEVITIKTE